MCEESDYLTYDLSKFGIGEINEAIDLLQGYNKNYHIVGDGVHIAFNLQSGYVFLTDEDYRTFMMNDDKLEEWFYCGYCGAEGFADEIKINMKSMYCEECHKKHWDIPDY